ncbi:MAG TPA: MMPL family transporter, partial [Rhodothermales bacterium]|nr:MMPL family transporter [Rhodothermales bacterium]
DFAHLVPEEYESVKALERLRANVGGDADVAVAIESPSFEANRRFADTLVARAMRLRDPATGDLYFTRVTYRRDTEFLRRNALYLATDAELDSLEQYLRGQIEAARLEANPFYFDIGELDSTATDASPEARLDSAGAELQRSYQSLVGQEYPISPDSTTLALRFFPGGSSSNLDFIARVYRDLQREVDRLGPRGYHPSMQVTLAGRLIRRQYELDAIRSDVTRSFGGGVALVLLVVVGFFVYKSYRARAGRAWRPKLLAWELARAPALALVVAVPLAASLAWTFGATYAVYGTLNLMTSTLALVLFGMGIDYGIHFYGRYVEERGRGAEPREAAVTTFLTTGEAITTTAITTAAAFFLFMIADFRGFSEFGFIAGAGILFALVAMVVVLPALLVLFERWRLLKVEAHPVLVESRADLRRRRIPAARAIVRVSLLLLVGAVVLLPRVGFEYDVGRLDPRLEEYENLQNAVRKVSNDRGRRNASYIVVDRADEVPVLEDTLRAIAARDTVIGAIETLQSRFPMAPAAQQAKLARLDTIRALLDDEFLRASGDSTLALLRAAASTTQPLTLDELPPEFKQAFVAKDGSVGRLVIIYPRGYLSDGRKSMHLADLIGTVEAGGKTYHAGSTSIVAADMLRLMEREAPLMVVLTLVLIVVLKVASLRSVKWALVALAPLLMGFVLTFGVMVLLGWTLNFYNMIVLPAILGIGDDA